MAKNYGINAYPVSAEQKLRERDRRFDKVIERVYTSDEMKGFKRKETLEVVALLVDPKGLVPMHLAWLGQK